MMNSRRIGSRVYLVLNGSLNMPNDVVSYVDQDVLPTCLEDPQETPETEALRAAKDRLKEENRDRIEAAEMDEILPKVIRNNGAEELMVTQTVYTTRINRGTSIASLVSFDLDDRSGSDSISSIVGWGLQLYASKKAIYLSQPVNFWGGIVSSDEKEKTLLHKFDISSDEPFYFGSGIVEGHLLWSQNGQFSMSEHEGHLRVATSVGFNDTNHLYVLDAESSAMNVVGSILDFKKDESIYSVRFIGNKGFIVTYRQIDPLFTIDLSDPTQPTILGELKVPGFSTYLHPFDDGHLIGIGKDTEETSSNWDWFRGVKMSLFDVRDMTKPSERHNIIIGTRGTDSEALSQHHAFTFDKSRGLIALPITLYTDKGLNGGNWGEFQYRGLQIYRLNATDGFDLVGEIKLGLTADGEYSNSYKQAVRRSIIIGDGDEEGIIVIKSKGIGLYDISNGVQEIDSLSW